MSWFWLLLLIVLIVLVGLVLRANWSQISGGYIEQILSKQIKDPNGKTVDVVYYPSKNADYDDHWIYVNFQKPGVRKEFGFTWNTADFENKDGKYDRWETDSVQLDDLDYVLIELAIRELQADLQGLAKKEHFENTTRHKVINNQIYDLFHKHANIDV